jgi:hypothetical protein
MVSIDIKDAMPGTLIKYDFNSILFILLVQNLAFL